MRHEIKGANSESRGLDRLIDWYDTQCVDGWEHAYGIRVESIDNPGWSVNIDLAETAYEGRSFQRQEVERSENDWFHCWIDDDTKQFCAACGSRNLDEVLSVFADWAS